MAAGGNYFETAPGQGRVYHFSSDDGFSPDIAPAGVYPLLPNRRLRITARFVQIDGVLISPLLYNTNLGADYAPAPGGHWSAGGVTTPSYDWQSIVHEIDTNYMIAGGGVYMRPLFRIQASAGGRYWLKSLLIEDITESDAAAGFAEAASTSASQAEVSSGEAGEYAFASQESATTAEIQAGVAATYSGQASEARDDAVAASIESGTAAATSTAAAATATVEASEATDAAASASASAAIAASVGQRALNPNSGYDNYPTPTGLPPGHSGWASVTGSTRVAAAEGGYDLLMEVAAGFDGGIAQNCAGAGSPGTYYVMEATVRPADDGALAAAGLYCEFYDDTLANYYGSQALAFTTDSSGTAVAGGLDNRVYRFDRLFKTPDTLPASATLIFYQMGKWGNYGSIVPTSRILWKSAVIRLATAQDIAAGVALPALASSVSATQAVVANLEDQYALARYEVAAVSPGGRAALALFSDTYGTDLALSADQIWFGENTYFDNATDTLRTVTGTSARVLALGAGFGTDGTLTQWEGPSSVAFSAMARENAYFYLANTAPRLGGSAVPGGQTQGIRNFSAGGVSASTTIAAVVAGSKLEFTAGFNPVAIDDDSFMNGYLRFEEGNAGTWTQIGDDYPVTVNSSGGALPGGAWSADSVSGAATALATRAGSVTYRATFTRTGGANIAGAGYGMDAQIVITAPLA